VKHLCWLPLVLTACAGTGAIDSPFPASTYQVTYHEEEAPVDNPVTSTLDLDPIGTGSPTMIAYHLPVQSNPSDPFAVDMGLAGPNTASATPVRLNLSSSSTTTTQATPYWQEDMQRWGSAATFSYYELVDTSFRISDQRESWDRAERYEVTFHTREPVHGRVEALIGGFIFWEERDWEEGAQKVINDTWGFGIDAGAMLYPMENAETRKFNIGIMPYFRIAMGFNDGDFRNIDTNLPSGVGNSSGSLGDLRFDVGAGVEARVVVARRFFGGVGVGYNWWNTANGAVGTTRDGSTVIVVGDSLTFKGDEAYIRVSAGLYF
jgi:hypothetical protein